MDLLQHEMLVACFFSCFCIPFDLRWLFLNLISVQIVKGNGPICQTCHLQISNVINIAGIFQNRRNIRSHIAVSVLHADNHRTVLTRNINLTGIILEHDRQGIGTADPDHGMVDGIHRSMLIFLVIVIDELHCHFGVCRRIELIALAKKLILQFLVILNDTIVNTDHISIIGSMGMSICLRRFPVGSPAGVTDTTGTSQGMAMIGFLRQRFQTAFRLYDFRFVLTVTNGKTG